MAEIYKCKEFKNSLEQDPNMSEAVNRKIYELENRIELIASKSCQQYTKDIFVQKIFSPTNVRIIIQKYYYEKNNITISFLRDFISAKNYEPEWRRKIEPYIHTGQWLTDNPLKVEDIQAAIIEYLNKTKENKIILEKPPAQISNWLNEFNMLKIKFNIYETAEWVKFSSDNNIIDGMKDSDIGDYAKLLKKIISSSMMKDISIHNYDIENRNLKKALYEDICIIYENITLKNSSERIILLHNGGNCKTQEPHIQKAEAKAKSNDLFLKKDIVEYDLLDISQISNKAYPASAVDNRDLWLSIQKNDESCNLSLLPEQVKLLREYQFPKFINGQAGSGKSTMLYYLFAEISLYKLADEFEGEPIFLTENQELLEKANSEIRDLLKFNSEYVGWKLPTDTINKYFFSFQNYLYNNLLQEAEKENYDIKKFIKFSKFKELYNLSSIDLSIKRKYTPELAWYIISSYIKGYEYDKFISPDIFVNDIPKKDKGNIDKDTFKGVYEKIWMPFYKKLTTENGYWDKLDLVREILIKYKSLPFKYTVIFCDEAQDFTRIELQLLMKLSQFTNYDLTGEHQVPITFAGDPFQTVNPTGFNLENIRRLFYNVLTKDLNFKFEENDLIVNLKYNYRSSKSIVNFANLIQFFRYRFLETKELKEPQESKNIEDVTPPLLFSLDDLDIDNFKELQDKLKYDIVIVPCDEGEEDDFKDKDNWLKENVNLKSSVRAKGSEYGRVVIYKFGDEFLSKFNYSSLEALIDKNYNQLNDGEKFGLSFFFNKLYVAVTRAQNKLIIIDTKNGVNKFWKVLINNNKLLSYLNSDPIWNKISTDNILNSGNSSDLKEADVKTAKRNAEEDRRKGLLFRDKDKMITAAKFFEQIGEDKDAIYCRAKSFEFDNKWLKSGQLFDKISDVKEASRCFWVGGHWKELIELHPSPSEKEYLVRNFVAEFMLGEKFDPNLFCIYSEFIGNAFTEDDNTRYLDWKNDFINLLHKKLKGSVNSLASLSINIAKALEGLKSEEKDIHSLIAEYYFSAHKYKEAKNYWDKAEEYDNDKYYEANLELTDDINNKIYYTSKLNRDNEICDIYLSKKYDSYNNDSLKIIFESFIKQDKFSVALTMGPKLNLDYIFANISNNRNRYNAFLKEFISYLLNILNNQERIRTINVQLFDYFNKFLEATEINKFINKIILPRDKKGFDYRISSIKNILENDTILLEIIIQIIKIISLSDLKPSDFIKDNQQNWNFQNIVYFIIKRYFTYEEINELTEKDLIIALERTNDIYVDILILLEHHFLRKKGIDANLMEFITNRWIKVKYKQLMIERRKDKDGKMETEELENLKSSTEQRMDYQSKLNTAYQQELVSKLKFPYKYIQLSEIDNLEDLPKLNDVHIYEENIKDFGIDEDKLTMIRKLKSYNMSNEHISDVTNVSINIIENI